MKTTVIFHSADFDGLFCREIARKFLPDAELIGWDFGDKPLEIPSNKIYVMDLPVDRVLGFDYAKVGNQRGPQHPAGLIWIDHHKSSIESHPTDIAGYRIDGVAACRLAWQYFSTNSRDPKTFALPTKEHFVNREVIEPLAVRLAGEYDIWDKRDPDAELFQHGLRSRDLEALWPMLLAERTKPKIAEIEMMMDAGHPFELLPDGTYDGSVSWVKGLLTRGEAIQYAKTRENESIIKAAGFDIEFEGLRFLACNHARYNSHLFTAGLKPEHEALLGFAWRDGQWAVSLYHAPGKEHHDLSEIAKKHGGGGHRGACGFRAAQLPFIP